MTCIAVILVGGDAILDLLMQNQADYALYPRVVVSSLQAKTTCQSREFQAQVTWQTVRQWAVLWSQIGQGVALHSSCVSKRLIEGLEVGNSSRGCCH